MSRHEHRIRIALMLAMLWAMVFGLVFSISAALEAIAIDMPLSLASRTAITTLILVPLLNFVLGPGLRRALRV